MRAWEKLLFSSEQERLAYYKTSFFPPNFSVAVFWVENEFKEEMYRRARLEKGDQVLLISEDVERCGLTAVPAKAVGPQGKLHVFDVMSKGRTLHQWSIFGEICNQYDEAFFDAVVATTVHHMDNLDSEIESIFRVVKKGGRVVLADNGPGKAFFESAEQDAHLKLLADLFVHTLGIRFNFSDDVDDVYEKVKAFGLKHDAEAVKKSMAKFVEKPDTFEQKGFWLVSGVKK